MIRKIAAYKIEQCDSAIIIQVNGKELILKHSALDNFTEERIRSSINAWANNNGLMLPDFGIHRNRDRSLCIWIGESPKHWPEDEKLPIYLSSELNASYSGCNYYVINNMWNRSAAGTEPYSQSMEVLRFDNRDISVQWTWDWPKGTGVIKAYPSIVFGKNPWSATAISTTLRLPVQLSKIGSFLASYHTSIRTPPESKYNTAFDLWLTSDAAATRENITTEIMIWANHQNSGLPIDGQVDIDGEQYSYYISQRDWLFIGFMKINQDFGGEIRIDTFLKWLVKNRYIPASSYLSDIEFGNELAYGKGVSYINHYSIRA